MYSAALFMESNASPSGAFGEEHAQNSCRIVPKYTVYLSLKSEGERNNNYYVTKYCAYSQLLTWGAGKFGQLGNRQWQDSVQMQDIRSLVPTESGRAVQVSAGCGHSGFITSEGHTFTCGDNRSVS